jgi:hypothetical protein
MKMPLKNHRSVIAEHGFDYNYNFLSDDEWKRIGQLHKPFGFDSSSSKKANR